MKVSTESQSMLVPALGGVVGAAFFLWIGGTRLVHPREFDWLMKLDWRVNFLGWHIFRNEPWHWPPGRLEGFLAGEGTSIGLTDSIPLAAFMFKPFDEQLPTQFQYIGLWLFGCFVLQGTFGVLLTRIWTREPLLQLFGAGLFVLVPTLLMRVGHPALTSHFLLLWALFLYLSTSARRVPSALSQIGLALCAGLTHPYLAVMTLAILAALPIRDRTLRSAGTFVAACVAVVAGWWAAGFFTMSGAEDLSAGGLALYSMNLLSPITPVGWSTILPELPIATDLQSYEGFQYLGLGNIAIVLIAAAVVLKHVRHLPWMFLLPLAAICLLCAIYALSPRVTFANILVVDWSSPVLDRFGFFRATGRFFWPMTYLLLGAAIGLIVSKLDTRVAIAILAVAIALQLVDLRNAHAERRVTSRSDAFHAWPRSLQSSAWHDALAHYDHIVLVPASQCGGAPIGYEELAHLAGTHGLTINSGEAARWDERKRRQYCAQLAGEIAAGIVDSRSLYVLDPAQAVQLRAAARKPVVCGSIDAALVCVTAESYEPWRHAAALH